MSQDVEEKILSDHGIDASEVADTIKNATGEYKAFGYENYGEQRVGFYDPETNVFVSTTPPEAGVVRVVTAFESDDGADYISAIMKNGPWNPLG